MNLSSKKDILSYLIKIRTLIFADRADGTFRFDGIKADSFNTYDFTPIAIGTA